MAGVNKVIVLGHLGRDPEMRYQPSGAAIANFSMATSENFKDKDGNKQERTEWHRIVFFGRTAEIAGEYLRKGSMAYVEGRLQTRKWTDKDGLDRYTTEIIGDRLQLVGKAGGNGGSNNDDPGYQGENEHQSSGGHSSGGGQGRSAPAAQQQRRAAPPPPVEEFDDDIPF